MYRYRVAAPAAFLIAVLLVAALLLANPLRRASVLAPHETASPSPAEVAAIPSATGSESPSTASGFQCGADFGPVTQDGPVLATVSAVRTGTHAGYDRITIEFGNGAPRSFDVRAQANATFVEGASGRSVSLPGDSGLLLTVRGADEHTTYSGPTDFKTGFAKLLEARQVEDFEGTVEWALGLSGAACYRVTVMTGPDRLVIDAAS